MTRWNQTFLGPNFGPSAMDHRRHLRQRRVASARCVARRSVARQRAGASMVEFAIVAPLLFFFFFTAFEFCRVAMIRHTADNAVYEAARVAIIPGATANEARAQATLILNTLGLNNVNINITPAVIKRDTEEVTVRIQVPLDGNSFVPNQFFGGKTVERELTLQREGNRGAGGSNAGAGEVVNGA